MLKKLLALVGIHILENDREKPRVGHDHFEHELAEWRERCTKVAHARFVSERVRPEDIVISHARPDITTAQDLKIIYDEAEAAGHPLELLPTRQMGEVQVIVAECRVQRRIARRGLGITFQDAYASLHRQLGGEPVPAASGARGAKRIEPIDVSIELSDAGPPHGDTERDR